MHRVALASDTDIEGWRREARALLGGGVAPEQVSWSVGPGDAGGLFDEPAPVLPAPATSSSARVPPAFLEVAERALLHRAPGRFALLYRLLWRLQREPGLREDSLDPDWVAARALAKAVHRDQHKMRAFVRFHERSTPQGPQFVAWFEPEHHIVASQAGFFQRRFAAMRWAIFTPAASIAWDGERVHHGEGARREDIPREDDTQALWLTYYANIFNPARLKLDHMAAEMPRKYWHNLPEARLIAPLVAQAAQRVDAMVAQPATPPRRRGRLPALVPSPAADARQAAAACRLCPHAAQATQTVWGEGPDRATLMLVGEQPGDQEDLQGRPFVGPSGQLLDRALAAAGLDRASTYLTNAVKHFRYELRGKRRLHKTPGQREIVACAGWLQHEIEQVRPERLVALGATAAQALLGEPVSVERLRGRWLQRPDGRPVLVTWHPAALLRRPPHEQAAAFEAWVQDLRQAAGATPGGTTVAAGTAPPG